MDTSTNSDIILKKIYECSRLTMSDSDDKIKNSIEQILHLWPKVLAAGENANDDELFGLNVSRAVITQVFTIVLSKDFFHKDPLLVRKIFFTCFNILVDYAHIFQNNNSIFIDSNIRLILKMLSSLVSLVQFKDEDFSKSDDKKLLIAMREHIDQESTHDNLTNEIISLVWNLSDKTILVPVLLQTDYAKSVIQWIINRESKFRDDRLYAPVHVLHNLARHDDGIDQLNNYNAMEVIEDLKFESNIQENSDDMTIHIAMIRALLTDKEKIKFDAENYPINTVKMIVKLTTDAAKNERYRCSGSHVSEPLTVLVKLFYNDNILNEILSDNEIKSQLIELFTLLLNKFYSKINSNNDILENYTCIVILNLFWLLSNHQQYRDAIRDNEQLMNIVKKAANDEELFKDPFMPRTMKSIKAAANEIIDNLDRRN